MTNEEFLKDIFPNHTDKSKWNKSELLHILDKYQALQLQQTGVICSCYDLAYPKASKFMNTADEKLQKIIDKLTDDEMETLRDRFADFYVSVSDHCI